MFGRFLSAIQRVIDPILRVTMPEIIIKSPEEIQLMRKACKLASKTLIEAGKMVVPGQNTLAIDDFVYDFTVKYHGIPAPLHYPHKGENDFPNSCCISVNEVVCHGIPSKQKILKEGDIVNIDITTILDGWHGDCNATFYCGTPSKEAVDLVETTRRCLEIGIGTVHPGGRIGDIGAAIQAFAESRGFSVVRDYVGHGIGRLFHENLQIPHFGKAGHGLRMYEGMTFTIEPMINSGDYRTRQLDDGWTAVTYDKKWSAQFEHTLLVTKDGVEVLTAFDEPLVNSLTPADFKF